MVPVVSLAQHSYLLNINGKQAILIVATSVTSVISPPYLQKNFQHMIAQASLHSISSLLTLALKTSVLLSLPFHPPGTPFPLILQAPFATQPNYTFSTTPA